MRHGRSGVNRKVLVRLVWLSQGGFVWSGIVLARSGWLWQQWHAPSSWGRLRLGSFGEAGCSGSCRVPARHGRCV